MIGDCASGHVVGVSVVVHVDCGAQSGELIRLLVVIGNQYQVSNYCHYHCHFHNCCSQYYCHNYYDDRGYTVAAGHM